MPVEVKGKQEANTNFSDVKLEEHFNLDTRQTFNVDVSLETQKLLRQKHNVAIIEDRFDPSTFFADFRQIWAFRKESYEMYTGEDVEIYHRPNPTNRKDINKVNNRIHVPFFNLIVKQGVQYLNANPTVFDYDNSKELRARMEKYEASLLSDPENVVEENFDDKPLELIEFEDLSSELKMDTKLIEIATYMGACGNGFLMHDVFERIYPYRNDFDQDKFHKIRSTVVEPWYAERLEDSAVVMRPRWSKSNELYFIMEVWTHENVTMYKSKSLTEVSAMWTDASGLNFDHITLDGQLETMETIPNPLGEIPLIEFRNNENRRSDFFHVTTLIDAVDKTMSDQQNEIEQFRMAYLFMTGKGLSKEMASEILSQSGIITTNDEHGDARYLTKELNVEFNQFHLNKLVEQIYTHTNTIDFNGEAFTGNSSGESRQWQIKPLDDRAKIKEQFMTEGLEDFSNLIEAFMDMPTSGYSPSNFDSSKVSFTFRPSVPIDIVYMADAISKLDGVVSKQTLAKQVPFVEDGALEQKQMSIEKTRDMGAEFTMMKLSSQAEAESFPDEGETGNETTGTENPKPKEKGKDSDE